MDKALYTIMTGAGATLRAQATVANNLANVNTVGFKAERVGTEPFQVPGQGLATRIDAVQRAPGFDASPGPVITTGNELDIALHPGVWLAVQARDGTQAYTRSGELRLTANGQLTTASGLPVLGDNGPVAIPPNAKLDIAGDGTISIQPLGQGPETVATVGRLGLFRAEQPNTLKRREDGLMQSDPPLPPAAGTALTVGALEGSNVNSAQTLVEMIALSRQFEMQVKLIHSGDQLAQSSTSLLRTGR
jgi:flagellar basal-body rod protein FlgF